MDEVRPYFVSYLVLLIFGVGGTLLADVGSRKTLLIGGSVDVLKSDSVGRPSMLCCNRRQPVPPLLDVVGSLRLPSGTTQPAPREV